MKKLNTAGYYICMLFAVSLFLSEKFTNNVLIYLLCLLFAIGMCFKENRNKFKQILDKKIFFGLILFIFIPLIIVLLDGGFKTRFEIHNHFKFLLFFPLAFFVDDNKKVWNFTKFLLGGSIISLAGSLVVFIKEIRKPGNLQNMELLRIHFELSLTEFSNIMCILLLFLLSFFFFYKKEDKRQQQMVKIFLGCLIVLDIFILILTGSKIIYICLIPTIVYILYKKNKVYILFFFLTGIGSYFILPKSIFSRMKYIFDFKKDPSIYLRLIFWDTAVNAIKRKPLFGWKSAERIAFNDNYYRETGVIEYIKVNYYSSFTHTGDLLNTHNMYLQHLVYYGLVGGIFLILLFFIIIPSRLIKINFYKEKNGEMDKVSLSRHISYEIALKASYICFLIQGMTEKNLNNAAMIFSFAILLFLINFFCTMQKEKYKLNE